MKTLLELRADRWEVAPERFSGLAFLHRGSERILYDTKNQEAILTYRSTRTIRHNDWEELQEILGELCR